MNLQFEERLKKEALRVKVESEKHHLEDKRVAIEHTRAQADTKLQEQKKKWEKQLADAQRQVPTLPTYVLSNSEPVVREWVKKIMKSRIEFLPGVGLYGNNGELNRISPRYWVWQ